MGSKRTGLLPPVIVLAAVLLLWQAAVWLLNTDAYILPSPTAIAKQAYDSAPQLAHHMRSTLVMTLIGFVVGASLGFLIAALLHVIPWVKSGFYPLLVLSQNVPIMALGPLLVLWFGFGMLPRVILITLVTFFPVAVAMMTGLSKSDGGLYNYMRMIGATQSQLFWRMELPGSMPHLFSGLKIAASYSVISAIYAESIGSDSGLGYFILLAQHGFETAKVFAAIAVIVLLSLALFGVIALAERMFVRGSASSRREGKQS
ncbi:ABC transporter permease [Paenibacillus sacheonensis]|uniref:ABC transporter permease subunit n=1 Tax=Paenibacillus sacheonensis TaxID=742054 RepID=A0A7X4YMI5_9BACL|nr:ABC transporter permease [Paenibacillus sacheonensis]MBM7564542.1 ABC-type nitrate/sulfonate/bicarbonate transport system permease component [Paenibacillus sacheonensis]NBC69101.1 ABC transporter permease subunit [Paenibacillus sacheonensis]